MYKMITASAVALAVALPALMVAAPAEAARHARAASKHKASHAMVARQRFNNAIKHATAPANTGNGHSAIGKIVDGVVTGPATQIGAIQAGSKIPTSSIPPPSSRRVTPGRRHHPSHTSGQDRRQWQRRQPPDQGGLQSGTGSVRAEARRPGLCAHRCLPGRSSAGRPRSVASGWPACGSTRRYKERRSGLRRWYLCNAGQPEEVRVLVLVL